MWLNIADSYAGSGKGAWKNKEKQKEMYKVEPGNPQTQIRTIQGNVKRKDMIGIPWMLAFALRADGWYLRQDIIWYKPNCMPESVKDRCTKSYEHIFLLSKSENYYFNYEAIKEPAVGFDTSSPRGSRGSLTPNSGRRKKTINLFAEVVFTQTIGVFIILRISIKVPLAIVQMTLDCGEKETFGLYQQ